MEKGREAGGRSEGTSYEGVDMLSDPLKGRRNLLANTLHNGKQHCTTHLSAVFDSVDQRAVQPTTARQRPVRNATTLEHSYVRRCISHHLSPRSDNENLGAAVQCSCTRTPR